MRSGVGNEGAASPSFPVRGVALAIGLTAMVYGALVWNTYDTLRFAEESQQEAIGIEKLRGTILRLDEVLTMSAKMAAATADQRWEVRYRQAEPELNAAIKKCVTMAPSVPVVQSMDQTDAANAKLVEMEYRAFALVRQGQLDQARMLLSSNEYEAQKRIYSEGVTRLMVGIQDWLNAGLRAKYRRLYGTLAGALVALTMSLGMWAVALRRIGAWRAELTRAGEALRGSEERHREILDSITDAFFALDEDMFVRYVNSAAERMLNRKADEVLGRRLFDVFPEARGSAFEINYAHCLRSKTALSFEVEFTIAPYANWYEVRVYPEEHGISVFFQAITERKRAEEEREKLRDQLAQAQKMESIGRLAGGIAHDFNNLLTVISGYSDLELRRTPPGDPQFRSFAEIVRASERAADLVRQLLAFSRKQVLRPEVLDLNAAVGEMEDMLRRLVSENIEVVVKLNRCVAPILADRHQIEQVIMNLAANARDAMPGGGAMTLETSERYMEGICPICGEEMPAGMYVELSVRDTGIGMDAHTLERLFEPFFTTKDLGKGTGLGLSTVQGIVRQSGGHIGVESEPGKGTIFHVYLPAAGRPVVQASLPQAAEVEGGSETILVVEDEEPVRRLIVAILRDCGYRVVDTGDAEEALRRCDSLPLDLLLTDMVMPRMSGAELAHRARLTLPHLRVLFISGYSEEVREPGSEALAGAKFLQKPFAQKAVAAKVREALDDL